MNRLLTSTMRSVDSVLLKIFSCSLTHFKFVAPPSLVSTHRYIVLSHPFCLPSNGITAISGFGNHWLNSPKGAVHWPLFFFAIKCFFIWKRQYRFTIYSSFIKRFKWLGRRFIFICVNKKVAWLDLTWLALRNRQPSPGRITVGECQILPLWHSWVGYGPVLPF